MAKEYNALNELRAKKENLKSEIKKLEDLMAFTRPKESLSVITQGYTDAFLKETTDDEGNIKTTFDSSSVLKMISHKIKSVLNRNTMMQVLNSETSTEIIQDTMKLGAVNLVTDYVQNIMKSDGWKKKAVGFALIYVAPLAIKYIGQKLDEYQRHKTTKSLEKLI